MICASVAVLLGVQVYRMHVMECSDLIKQHKEYQARFVEEIQELTEPLTRLTSYNTVTKTYTVFVIPTKIYRKYLHTLAPDLISSGEEEEE